MIGIVILHYLAYDMTVQCVNYARNSIENARIVVVDNASDNGSGIKLKELFEKDKMISVLLSNENLGFARGNNLGYVFLRNNYNLDYIIIMNNDILIKQRNFDKIIEDIYSRTGFAVLGPDIYNTYFKVHQNPSRLRLMDKSEIENWIYRFQKVEDNYAYSFLKMKVCDIRDKAFPQKKTDINRDIQHINPVLHGACFIFSKSFILIREIAFNPATFLYGEEDILAYECKVQGLKMVYSPELKVEHLEDVATNMRYKNEYTKKRMKNRQMLNSYRILYDLMRNN